MNTMWVTRWPPSRRRLAARTWPTISDALRFRAKPSPEVLRKIAHRREVDLTLPVDPRRELAPAVSRRAQLDGEIFDLAREETDHVHARHPWKNTTGNRAAIFPHVL